MTLITQNKFIPQRKGQQSRSWPSFKLLIYRSRLLAAEIDYAGEIERCFHFSMAAFSHLGLILGLGLSFGLRFFFHSLWIWLLCTSTLTGLFLSLLFLPPLGEQTFHLCHLVLQSKEPQLLITSLWRIIHGLVWALCSPSSSATLGVKINQLPSFLQLIQSSEHPLYGSLQGRTRFALIPIWSVNEGLKAHTPNQHGTFVDLIHHCACNPLYWGFTPSM